MLLLSSQSFPHYGLERFFDFAKKAGFDGVEITINGNFDTQSPKYLKTLEKRFGIPIKAFSMPQKSEGEYFAAYQLTVREFPRTTLNLSSPQSFSFGYKKWMEEIVPKLSQKYDLQFNRRNVQAKAMFGLLPDRPENSMFSLREKGRVCLDLSALWANKEEPMRTIEFLGDHLKHVYLSNVHRNIPYSPLPAGILPLESFLKKLAQKHFKGDFTVVISPKNLHEGDDEKLLEILVESKEYFEKYFTKLLT
jgi:sugar phosphate isomerase/epimerase